MPNLSLMELREVSLNASIGSSYLLQNISFRVDRGDRVAIIGASGAGKTSLLRLLNRLSSPSAGSIYFEDRDLEEISVVQLRTQVVLIPQESKLLGMTVRDAIAYPLKLQQLPKAEIQQRLETWVNNLNIADDWLDRNELQLSLGQRQLVAIARGLVMQPKILLLDEPTSALDLGIVDRLLTILEKLSRENETAIIMVNHQLEQAQKFARRILYLDRGNLIEDLQSDRLDWPNLRDRIVGSETEMAEEWD
jgi:D-methionine transport system ATP-binding protein